VLEGSTTASDEGEGEDGGERVLLLLPGDGRPLGDEALPIGGGGDAGELVGDVLEEAVGAFLEGLLGVLRGGGGEDTA
jgi:hypothetical protein